MVCALRRYGVTDSGLNKNARVLSGHSVDCRSRSIRFSKKSEWR
ncbi:MAG: hypothetical protein P8X74_05040 [Reinekea sp.]